MPSIYTIIPGTMNIAMMKTYKNILDLNILFRETENKQTNKSHMCFSHRCCEKSNKTAGLILCDVIKSDWEKA